MVPNAAPIVPNRGMRTTLNAMVSTVIANPSRSGVRGSPAARKAPLSMKNIIMPKMPRNMARRNGSASARTAGAALTRVNSEGAAKYPTAAKHDRQSGRRQEGLIDDAVDLVWLIRPHEAGHEHGHPGEERAQEDDHDEDDLPTDADRRVGRVAHEVPDHRVVDDPLQARDDVLEHRRPREFPDHVPDGTLDNRAIELPRLAP